VLSRTRVAFSLPSVAALDRGERFRKIFCILALPSAATSPRVLPQADQAT